MKQKNEINKAPILGTIEYEGIRYFIDINDDVYSYNSEDKSLTQIKDTVLINKILDYLEAKPLDIK